MTTASPSAAPTAYPAASEPAHGYSGPLPTLDATCSSATEVDIAPGRPPETKLPLYGFGRGPVYLTGQTIEGHAVWFASGEMADVVVAPSYTGAVTVQGHQLGGSGHASFASQASVVIAPRAAASYWRYWQGVLSFDKPGCYQVDVAGNGLHESVVVQAEAGQPLPG